MKLYIQHLVYFPQLCFVAAYFFFSLIGFVVSHAGIPAVVNAKSEHIDVDFDQHQILGSDPKGMHARITMLPVTLEFSLQAQLQAVKHLIELEAQVKDGQIMIETGMVVIKDDRGNVKPRKTSEWTSHSGVKWGAFWGLLVDLLFAGPLVGLSAPASKIGMSG